MGPTPELEDTWFNDNEDGDAAISEGLLAAVPAGEISAQRKTPNRIAWRAIEIAAEQRALQSNLEDFPSKF